jgi:hypothetical protein
VQADDERLFLLLERYLAGEASGVEVEAVREWLVADPGHALLLGDLRLIKGVTAERIPESSVDAAWANAVAGRAILAALLLLAVGVGRAVGQGPRNLLTGGLSEQALAAALIPTARWHPYPTIRDRADWDAVPQEMRAGFIRGAERYLNTTWERIPAMVTLQYIRTGNRSNYDAMNKRS